MSLTAQTLIDGAFDLCNVKQVGESLSTTDYTDALRRLNNFVRLLNNQSLISSFIGREVFQLVSGQSTYTIGPGGDFNTTRPFDLENAAVLQNATIASYSITGSSSTNGTFTVAGNQTGVFVSGCDFVVTGSTAGVNDGSYTVDKSAFSSSTTITVLESVPASSASGSAQVFSENGANTIEIPRSVITDDQYAAIQIKQLPNLFPTGVYFNANYSRGLASIYVWPVPNVSTYGLVLYRRNTLATFADLSTGYDVPPGFEEVLEYGLAKRLLTPYAVSNQAVRADIMQGFAEAMAVVKRTNVKVNDMPIDGMWTDNRRGYYNINTGTGGGSN